MRMRALQNCLERKVPVMLLAGNQYSFFPKLRGMGFVEGGNEVRYAVLGAYLISHIWVSFLDLLEPQFLYQLSLLVLG